MDPLSFLYDLEEKSICLRLEKASVEELSLALLSSNEFERWYALFCLQNLFNKEDDRA